jgi:hypothetical protein
VYFSQCFLRGGGSSGIVPWKGLLIKVDVMPGANNGHILGSSWIYTTTWNMFKKVFISVECNRGHEKFRSYDLLLAVVCAMQFVVLYLYVTILFTVVAVPRDGMLSHSAGGNQAVHPHQLHYRLRREHLSLIINHKEFK